MLVAEADAKDFIAGYSQLLEQFTGRRLRGSEAHVGARDLWFAQGRQIDPFWDMPAGLSEALSAAYLGTVAILQHRSTGTEIVYGKRQEIRREIRGLLTPLPEMVPPLCVVETVICQFRGCWIIDGLIRDLQVDIDRRTQRIFERVPRSIDTAK